MDNCNIQTGIVANVYKRIIKDSRSPVLAEGFEDGVLGGVRSGGLHDKRP
jgi:hypothetical protein